MKREAIPAVVIMETQEMNQEEHRLKEADLDLCLFREEIREIRVVIDTRAKRYSLGIYHTQ